VSRLLAARTPRCARCQDAMRSFRRNASGRNRWRRTIGYPSCSRGGRRLTGRSVFIASGLCAAPDSLTQRELAAANPPPSWLLAASPPVLVFDQSATYVRNWWSRPRLSSGRDGVTVFQRTTDDFVWSPVAAIRMDSLLKFTMDRQVRSNLQSCKSGTGNASNSTHSGSAQPRPSRSTLSPSGFCRRRFTPIAVVVFALETARSERHWSLTARSR